MNKKVVQYVLYIFLTIFTIESFFFLVYEVLSYNLVEFNFLKLALIVINVVISTTIITFIILNTIPYIKDFLLSNRSLLRMQSLSHPLLLKLSLEAPGTYHHSLMVANLAYKAAQEIKADAILARVGAYYHDIGKISDPISFIENQNRPEETKNTDIDTIKSESQKIINHVNYGVKIAKENNLPDNIISFIAEHHGTTQTIFFYNRAKIISPNISKKYFTYPGPKPLSKETAIVMLADAIEAKLRLYKDITVPLINKTVIDTVNSRKEDKQLELSGLNKEQLGIIQKSFMQTLISIHHQRISYKNEN